MKVPRGATKQNEKQNERLRGYILKRINKTSWMGYSGEIKGVTAVDVGGAMG